MKLKTSQSYLLCKEKYAKIEESRNWKNATTEKLLVQFMYKIESDFVPGRPGTENFVPGFLQLSLSRDKGTPGQEKIFVPGRALI